MDCIFCKIKKGEIKSDILYENEDFFVINDISHMAQKHYLIIPKEHFAYIREIDEKRIKIISKIFESMKDLEKILGLEDGYRIVVNQRENAGQTVQHLHFHILGGEKLSDKFN
ncbi:MAG: HIT domain-containing protein [Christensenellales bacterium]